MAQDEPRSDLSKARDTSEALILSAMHLFAEGGYDGTSTRAIAARAGANVAAISYHFGGKEGLRDACGQYVADRIHEVGGAALALQPPADPDAAIKAIERILETLLQAMLTQPQIQHIVAFVLHELGHPGPTIDRLYDAAFKPVHSHLCALWGVATGADPEANTTKLAVFTLIGQVIYFRIGKPLIQRRMGWADMQDDEIAQIRRMIFANLSAQIDAARKDRK